MGAATGDWREFYFSKAGDVNNDGIYDIIG